MEMIPREELDLRFPARPYQVSELGRQALEDEEYILYIHRHPIEDLDIWSLNKIIHEPPSLPYRDKIWHYLNERSSAHFEAGDFGLYRNCRYQMHSFLREERKLGEALGMLSEVAFYDLSGMGNNYDPQHLSIYAKHFLPYEDSLVKVAPGIISSIADCQVQLGLTDEDLKTALLDRMKQLTAPLRLFTPEECADIVLMEIRGEKEALSALYSRGRRHFNQATRI